jgi:hypothetical protein
MSSHDLAVICILCASLLALTGSDGWGWLLFIAVLCI